MQTDVPTNSAPGASAVNQDVTAVDEVVVEMKPDTLSSGQEFAAASADKKDVANVTVCSTAVEDTDPDEHAWMGGAFDRGDGSPRGSLHSPKVAAPPRPAVGAENMSATNESLEAEACDQYVNRVEASLIAATEAAERIQNGGGVELAATYILHLAHLIKTYGHDSIPLGTTLQMSSAVLAKEKLMATVSSGLRVCADILENRATMQGLSATLGATAASLENEHVSALLKGTAETAGTVLESEVVQRQIVRASMFAEQLRNDPGMQEQGNALLKRLETIANDDDVQEALDSALTLAQSTIENERLRNISSGAVSYAAAVIENPLVQSTGSRVGTVLKSSTETVLRSSTAQNLGWLTASTVRTVAGNEKVQAVVGSTVEKTGAVLTSEPVVKAASFGLNTTLTVASGVLRWASAAKNVVFAGKTVEELQQELDDLEVDTSEKLAQLQQDEIELVKAEEEARAAARAALARLRENQRTQQDLRVQLNKKRRQLKKRRAEDAGIEFVDDESECLSAVGERLDENALSQ